MFAKQTFAATIPSSSEVLLKSLKNYFLGGMNHDSSQNLVKLCYLEQGIYLLFVLWAIHPFCLACPSEVQHL